MTERVAALTGAASGIGRALAIELARHGYALALADRDEAGLATTRQLAGSRSRISTHAVDVAQRDAVDAFAAAALGEHGHINVLINNAGVSIAGTVAELSIDEIRWLIDINFWGTVYGIKAFLPALRRVKNASIVNLSSVFGLFGAPGQAAYAASKFAVRGFSESLRAELRAEDIHVMTVFPGGVKTNIAHSARIAAAADQQLARCRARAFEERSLKLDPAKAALVIARGIERRRDRVLIGSDAFQVELLTRTLGPLAGALLGKLAVRTGRVPSADTADA